jgi:uncharacterized damage-inducible protein DinB
MDASVRFTELLAYNEFETGNWRRFFEQHPAALDLPCDVAGAGTVRKLVAHVFLTELYFSRLLAGAPRSDFDKIPSATLDELFAMHDEAHRGFQSLLDKVPEARWEEALPLGFRDVKASRRKMFLQAMLHSIHHRAQLATLLRQNGFKQDWIHDIILSPVMP